MTSWLSFEGCSRVCGTYPCSEMMLVTMEEHRRGHAWSLTIGMTLSRELWLPLRSPLSHNRVVQAYIYTATQWKGRGDTYFSIKVLQHRPPKYGSSMKTNTGQGASCLGPPMTAWSSCGGTAASRVGANATTSTRSTAWRLACSTTRAPHPWSRGGTCNNLVERADS